MAHTAYLTLRGAKQGLISGGCNSKDSIGNRYQENHTDQITVLACNFSMHKDPYQHELEHDAVHLTKPIDKSSPLLAIAFARQEYLEGTIDFYRTNERGYNEKFYSIAVQKAVISGINSASPHAVQSYGEEMSETISLSYKGMQHTHLICGTMAFDGWESSNALSVVHGYQDLLDRKPVVRKQASVQEKTTVEPPEKPPQVFAKSSLVPSGTCEVGTEKETLSSIGQVAAYGAVAMKGATTTAGEITLAEAGGSVLEALGELATRTVRVIASPATAALALFVPTKLADGTLYRDEDLRNLAVAHTNIRLGFNESGQIYGYHVKGAEIPVREVKKHGDKFVVHPEEGHTIEWVPMHPQDKESHLYVNPIPDLDSYPIWIYPEHGEAELEGVNDPYVTPIHETDAKDYILIFPAESGIPPLYVVYKESPRDKPGTVTGEGKDVHWEDGYWLGEASDSGDGQFIPTKIADALRGRKFENFAEFQTAFWLEVAKDPELMAQFDPLNKAQVRKGNAPLTIEKFKWGKLKRYSLHHVDQIQHGGKVYDVDNIRIVTPGLHWGEIHGSGRIGTK